jgi:hypothetical protein
VTSETSVNSSDIVFFFGAGASAPFKIPTMKQFVTDFEILLAEKASKEEDRAYKEIKETLEKRLMKQVDLEAVFTVIDGMLNFSPEKIGLLPLYCANELKPPSPEKIEIYGSLRKRFQDFVKEKCVIPEESFPHIKDVYQDFFNRFAFEFEAANSIGKYGFKQNWRIFTTNYDLCLEYYWREAAGIGIDTGFEFNTVRNVPVLRPYKLLQEYPQVMQLFKLHGSVNWLVEKVTNNVIEVEMVRGQSHMGRRYEGEMMLYPIAEKELYLDPYISMLLRLNQELERKSKWVVIGYSFNDPIIREIFIRKSNEKKHLILVHKGADKIYSDRLPQIKGKVDSMNKEFGLEDTFRQTNHQIMHKLKDKLRFQANEVP